MVKTLGPLFFLAGMALPVTGQAQSFTEDFQSFLGAEYPSFDFSGGAAGVNSAFGGKSNPEQELQYTPVIFVHGNTDRAMGGHSHGWSRVIATLREDGYSSAELYAMTWGDGEQSTAIRNHHSDTNVDLVRKFIEAVLAYTGADKVNVVGHSMGVTLSRGAIKGMGRHQPLTSRINLFVGIAGANRGIGACLNPFSEYLPTCNEKTGFHPDSEYLGQLNAGSHREGAWVYSIWSHDDQVLGQAVIGRENPVPAPITAPIPGQDGEHSYHDLDHLESRDQTAHQLADWLQSHP